jgi:O-antigen/teichoic acid export membrane protein
LNALGETDFGLFSVVGSLILFITVLNSIMGSSVSRHFAYAMGSGNPEEVNHWFKTALIIHLCLATTLISVGWLLGEYIVTNYLTIPAERVDVCVCVFRISLGAAFFSMISIPFMAMFTAKQCLTEVAIWGITQSVSFFILAFFLTKASGDRLMLYALGMAGIISGVQIGQIVRAFFLFNECSLTGKHWFSKIRLKKIFSFASWSLFGGLGITFRNQGSAILINLYYGPQVNAAYGIAMQVSNQVNQLSAAMMGAFSPEITSSEGRGERVRMLNLSMRACKLGTLLVLLFAVPLMAEMNYVLKLWLQEPPEFGARFCNLILCTFLIERLTSGYMLAVNAEGKIAGYQATVGGVLLMTLPLSWFFFEAGYPPTSVGAAFIITMLVCSFSRVLWVKYKFCQPVYQWIQNVIIPCLIVAVGGIIATILPRFFLVESFHRLVLVSLLSGIVTLVTTWFFAFDEKERKSLKKNIIPLLQKSSPKGSGRS